MFEHFSSYLPRKITFSPSFVTYYKPYAILKRNVSNKCFSPLFLYTLYCSGKGGKIWIEENRVHLLLLFCQQIDQTKFMSPPLHISNLLHYNPSGELWEISLCPVGAVWTTFRTLPCVPLALCFFSLPKCGKAELNGRGDIEAGLLCPHLLEWQVPVHPSLPLTPHVQLSSYAGSVLVFPSPVLASVLTVSTKRRHAWNEPDEGQVRPAGWVGTRQVCTMWPGSADLTHLWATVVTLPWRTFRSTLLAVGKKIHNTSQANIKLVDELRKNNL